MNKRSVWAVVAGVLSIIGVTTIVDVMLHAAGFYPPLGQSINDVQALVGTFYRVVIGVAGAWLTARLAPAQPMKHALILGCIGTALGLVGVIATWNKALGPGWYSVAQVVLAIPEVWVGAKIYELRSRSRQSAGV